jgi:hypothetical protein
MTMTTTLATTALAALALLAGCELLPGQGNNNTLSPGEWAVLGASPCGFNRTDALHVDDDGAIWTGCGTNTEGQGLFVSTDTGQSWGLFEPANAANFFATMRVNSISRGDDGVLYVAGTGRDVMVAGVDGVDEVSLVLAPGALVDESFTVGHFRRDSQGRAIAESLTGTGVMMRGGDDEDFVAANAFVDDSSHQILDLTLDGDTFVAVGSTISEPNLIFEETPVADQPIGFTVTDLSSAEFFFGELRAVASADGVTVVGGLDEDTDFAVIHALDGANVTTTHVADVITDILRSTVRGACAVNASTFFVVGEESVTNGQAFVLQTTDAGATFTDVTMPDPPSALSRCVVVDGTVTVAGSGGFVAQQRIP